MTDPAPPDASTPGDESLPAGYTLFTVLAVPRVAAPEFGDLEREVAELPAAGVTLRGLYDVTGMRADAEWGVECVLMGTKASIIGRFKLASRIGATTPLSNSTSPSIRIPP